MTRLTIIRHAQAHCNVAGTIGGPQTCTGLTDHGRAQAALLARRLRHELANADKPIAIYTSPRQRVAETANIVADTLGLTVTALDDLQDPHYGPAADGQRWTDVTAKARRSPERGDMTAPLAPGGEPWSRYITRTAKLISHLAAERPNTQFLLFGHAETVQAAHQIFLGLPAEQKPSIRYDVEHTSITVWQHITNRSTGRWTLVSHNDHHHLRPCHSMS